MMSEADSGDLSPSLVEGEVKDFALIVRSQIVFSLPLSLVIVLFDRKYQVSHHTRPGECEVDSDPPPTNNRSSNNEEHGIASPAAADVNNSTLNTSEEIGTTADLEDCDVHSEQGELTLTSDYVHGELERLTIYWTHARLEGH